MAILETEGEVDVAAVQSWLAQPLRLAKTTAISLPQKDMGDDATALLAALTLRCCQLCTLRLAGNGIGDAGAGCLAESLKLLAPLKTLDLSDNRLTATGAAQVTRSFFRALTEQLPARPRILDLSKNPLQDHGVASVARGIPKGQRTPTGRVFHRGFPEPGVCLGRAPGALSTVKDVILRLRAVGCSSATSLPELCSHTFCGLDLSSNALGEAAVETEWRNGSFDPQCLTPLVRLLEPRALVRSHVVHWHARAVGVRKTAWLLEGEGEEGWMIKEISCKRRCCNIPTALENCDSLIQNCVELQTPSGEHTNDLLISRRCPGVQLCRFFSDLDLRLVENQERDPLTGEATYHTDFHPSNVLYEPQSDTLTFIDLDGMGSSGISDDVEKFERLLWTFSAERYASAFRLKYMALAKPLAKPQRSSTKSTAASSEDLYPPTATVVTRRLPRGERRPDQICHSLVDRFQVSELAGHPQLEWL
eukprot:g16718.t1